MTDGVTRISGWVPSPGFRSIATLAASNRNPFTVLLENRVALCVELALKYRDLAAQAPQVAMNR